VPQNDGYLIRLFNSRGAPENLFITWKDKPAEVYFSDLDGKRTAEYIPGVLVPSWGFRTLKVRK
jgi:hypothetical protein